MKINKENIQFSDIDIIAEWLNYIVSDINSYDELTIIEKSIIPKNMFDRIFKQ